MWRSIFIAIGLMAIIIGVECMMIESAVFYSPSETQASSFMNPTGQPSANTREWRPQEWFPFLVLSVGAITVVYAFTLPKRIRTAMGTA
ncbi:MAG: hypothetical protein AAGG48_03510 [Planctomycetota bacterium]